MQLLSVVPGFLLSLFLSAQVLAADQDLSNVPVETLIDDLALIDQPTPGIDGLVDYSAFLAEETPPRFVVGVLGVPPPQTPPEMRELVRRGVSALPALLHHLDDARPTKLIVGADAPNFRFMFRYFSDEYDRRSPAWPKKLCDSACTERVFAQPYTVKIGDVCFALIGQIVNRRLAAIRYQPTAGLVINSPVEMPDLVDRVRFDWTGLDTAGHLASLFQDVRTTEGLWVTGGALARLRFYYPAEYQGLAGADLRKRQAFEADEARRRLQ